MQEKKSVDSCIYACACIFANYINHMAGKTGNWWDVEWVGINESRKYLAVYSIRVKFV